MHLSVNNISKKFSAKPILKNISFELKEGQSLAVTGHNGSGKTTLIKIICGLTRADSGQIIFTLQNKTVPANQFKNHFALVGPYLQLYGELTAFENLQFVQGIKGLNKDSKTLYQLLNQVGLKGRAHDYVKTFSSGMKQRLKYAFALVSSPKILFLDEPTSNLDEQGMEMVYSLIKQYKSEKIVLFATNDKADLEFADRVVEVDA